MKEVQAYLGDGRETILQWIVKRNMPAYKAGKLWKFKLSEVDEWIRSGAADVRNTEISEYKFVDGDAEVDNEDVGEEIEEQED